MTFITISNGQVAHATWAAGTAQDGSLVHFKTLCGLEIQPEWEEMSGPVTCKRCARSVKGFETELSEIRIDSPLRLHYGFIPYQANYNWLYQAKRLNHPQESYWIATTLPLGLDFPTPPPGVDYAAWQAVFTHVLSRYMMLPLESFLSTSTASKESTTQASFTLETLLGLRKELKDQVAEQRKGLRWLLISCVFECSYSLPAYKRERHPERCLI